MNADKYSFTRAQLCSLLYGTVEMFQEYLNVHDKSGDEAETHAVTEMLEGIDAERELFQVGEVPYPTLQIIEAA